eukprot:CAMPEP_0203846614 /NCGR_PEP_ID=MMETSP0359-20131031/4535_1 /ASSEMBLY_ACC=CAM_ASM_000338 /TAXON_ID=268821 /ORGANISM="Scrippsiella Hangoei, Strain SHTV-5" /LENGTH=70 /DNA_ID=CAMNT_0050761967 /DNA_START=130 /DNA_END=339 /DNA_ORIENTATION=+
MLECTRTGNSKALKLLKKVQAFMHRPRGLHELEDEESELGRTTGRPCISVPRTAKESASLHAPTAWITRV